MKPLTFMVIAGETSGDLLASELVLEIGKRMPNTLFFGAGGSKMSAAGVNLSFDMTQHAVTGLTDVFKNILKFRRLFNELLSLAIERKPDVFIGVDFGGFNLRFGHAIKEYVRAHPSNWNPKIIQFVSPQVWASRPKRAYRLEADYDLLLSIFPFEKDWYTRRTPKLRVDFVGHPMLDREQHSKTVKTSGAKSILLLPGSRRSELQRHLPPMLKAVELMRQKLPTLAVKMVLPNESLSKLAKRMGVNVEIQVGNLPQALQAADVAIASTGTVTMECAFYGLPTVTLYKTSRLTYEIGKRLITVKSLTMPNLLAEKNVYPEFIQDDASPENLAGAALELLSNGAHRKQIKTELNKIIAMLGTPGAIQRAANSILSLFS